MPPGFSAGCCIIPFHVRRKVEVEGNVELIPTINIYPADKLIDNPFLCFKTGTVVQVCISDLNFSLRGRSTRSAESIRQSALSFDIPFDRQQLADFLCVERAAMSAELSKLQKEGLQVTKRNHFQLLTR